MDKTINNIKAFNYKEGNTNLTFSLNIDNKADIKDFVKCLNEALKDLKPLTNEE